MTFSPKIENFPSVISASGNELADKMVEQVLNLGGEFEIDEVTGVRDNGKTKTVITAGREFECLAVVLANGVKHRMLGIEGEEELIGDGISFCAVCDGAFYKGKTVAVIGGGNSALQEAILLSEGCSKVTVVQNLSKLTGEAKLADILYSRSNVEIVCDTVVESFMTDGGFSGVVLKNTVTGETSSVKCDGVFVAIGLVPENNAFENCVSLDARGYYSSDETCVTKTPGIFVAGDCRAKSIRQVTTAVADGSVASLAACRYIDDLK
jgi:thioredoxin reductase (NADPH)